MKILTPTGEVINKCPRCGSNRVIFDERTGEYICGECGFVIAERNIDIGAEWRDFEEEERKRSRVGPAVTPAKVGFGISTDLDLRSFKGMKGERRFQALKLKEMHERASRDTAAKRSVSAALHYVRSVAVSYTHLTLPTTERV